MKLIMAIVANEDASRLTKALVKEHYSVTKLATTGGFLMSGNTTLLIGANNEEVNLVIEIIKNESKRRVKYITSPVNNEFTSFTKAPIEVNVGGATVFVIDVEQFIKI